MSKESRAYYELEQAAKTQNQSVQQRRLARVQKLLTGKVIKGAKYEKALTDEETRALDNASPTGIDEYKSWQPEQARVLKRQAETQFAANVELAKKKIEEIGPTTPKKMNSPAGGFTLPSYQPSGTWFLGTVDGVLQWIDSTTCGE